MSGRLRTLLLPALLALAIGCPANGVANESPDAWVEIRGHRVAVEIADTREKQALGLGQRDDLAWDHGMFFTYAKPAFYAFWMKDMRFSLDIVWILDNRIVAIDQSVPFEPGGTGPTLRPDSLVDAVLEVPAGNAAARGWRVGDRVVMEPAAR